MKKKLLIAILSLASISIVHAQSIIIDNMSGCTIDYAVAGSSTTGACDYASNIASIPPSTNYVYLNPYEFEWGSAGGDPGHSWAAGSSIGGWPISGWSWSWGEFRFTVDCGSGQCDNGAIGLPVSAWCSTPSIPAWTWSPTPGGCSSGITGAICNISSGNVTFIFY